MKSLQKTKLLCYYRVTLRKKKHYGMIGDKIKKLRKINGLTLQELANILNSEYPDTINFNKGKISKWENNREEPRLSSVKILADFFSVPLDYFNDKDNSQLEIFPIYNELKTPRQKKVLTYADNQLKEQKLEENNQPNKVVQFPKLFHYSFFDQALSAGTGQYLNEVQVEQIELPINVDADFVVPIYGDSMEPDYHSGDYVFVKLSVDLSSGDIGVFEYYGDAYIKELVVNDSGAYLHSLNPKYDDILVDADSDFRIIGEVVGKYREG